MASLVNFFNAAKNDVGRAVHDVAQAPRLIGHAVNTASNTLGHDVQAGQGLIRQGVGNVTNNQPFAQRGRMQVAQNAPSVMATGHFLQQNVSKPLIQGLASLDPQKLTIKPTNGLTGALIGNKPAQNIEAGVASNYDAHKNLNPIARVGLAGAYGVGQVAQDLPEVAVAAKGLKVGVEAAEPVIGSAAKVAGSKALDVATQKPFRNISDQDLAAAGRVSQSRAGFGDTIANVKPGDVATYRKVQQKLGVPVNDHAAVDTVIAARRTYDVQMAQKVQAVKDLKTQMALNNQHGAVPVDPTQGDARVIPNTASDAAPKPVSELPSAAKPATVKTPQLKASSPKSTPEQIGAALGMSPEDIAKAKTDQSASLKPTPKVTPLERDSEKQASMKPQYNQAEKQQILEQANQQTTNKVSLNPGEGNTKNAIAQAEAIETERQARFAKADALGSKLSPQDQKLLSERADPNAKINPSNSKAFTAAAKAYDDAYDYHLAASRTGGATTLRFGGGKYAPLNFKATPEEMDKMDIPADQRLQKGKYTGFRDATRKYLSYGDAAKKSGGKLQPLYGSPVEDAKNYANASHMPVRNALLREALTKSNPGEVSDIGRGFSEDGKTSLHEAAGNLGFNVSKNLQDSLRNYKDPWEPKGTAGKLVLKGAEKTNALTKRALFLGTPFHYTNETASFVGKNLTHPATLAKGVGRAVRSTATKGGYQKMIDAARNDTGPANLENIRKMGVELPDNNRLQRSGSAYALTEAQRLLKPGLIRKAVDPDSPKAIALGNKVNQLMGRRNDAVQGSDKSLQKVVQAGAAAPRWTPSQLALVKDAINPLALRSAEGRAAGNYARGAVIGKRVLEGGVAVGASALAAHHLPNKQQFLNEAGLTPKNPIPNYEGSEQTKSKYPGNPREHQEIVGPTDQLGLAAGLLSDPGHFLQSRFSPAISFATKVATNTNWNGDKLAENNLPTAAKEAIEGKRGDLEALAKNAAVNSATPIGVQNLTNLQKNPNNPNLKQGLLQDVGGRLKTNPTDPNYKATQQYYSDTAASTKGLNPNELNAYNALHPTTKDPVTGQYIVKSTNFDAAYKALTYEKYPAVMAADTKEAKMQAAQGQKTDPFYTQLNPSQQKAYMAYEKMPPAGPDRANWMASNSSWYNKFANAQSNYFNGLPKGDPNKPSDKIAYPTPSSQVQNLMNSYYGITNSSAKAQFMDANPQVQDQLNKQTQYDNAVRVATGYAALSTYPTASPSVEAALNAKNYKAPGVQAYMNQADLYNIAKQGAANEFQGSTPSQTELKDVESLGNYGLVKNPDGTLAVSGTNSASNGAVAVGGYNGSGSSTKSSTIKVAKMKSIKIPSIKATAYKTPKLKLTSSKLTAFKSPKASKGYSSTTFKTPKIKAVKYNTKVGKAKALKVTTFKKVKVAA